MEGWKDGWMDGCIMDCILNECIVLYFIVLCFYVFVTVM